MSYHTFVNRSIILCFMGLVGYSLAKAISSGSFMGILLAFISLGAGIYFLYLMGKAKQQLNMQSEQSSQ